MTFGGGRPASRHAAKYTASAALASSTDSTLPSLSRLRLAPWSTNETSVTSVFVLGKCNVWTDPAGSYRYDPAVLTSGYSRYFHDPAAVKAKISPVCLCRWMVLPGSPRTRT